MRIGAAVAKLVAQPSDHAQSLEFFHIDAGARKLMMR